MERKSISADDLKEAELEIVKFCQREQFAEEISALQSGQAIKKGISIYRLNPQLHNDVLHVSGRLINAAMTEEVKRPMIILKYLYREPMQWAYLMMPSFQQGDDIDNYLRHFEHLARTWRWPEEEWSYRLVPMLTGL